MSEVARILDQMRRAWDGDAWHGPPLWPLLADVSAKEADARPIAGAHTIAELVFHIAFCKDEARRRVGGEHIVSPDAESWPPHGVANEAAWKERRAFLQTKQRDLEETVAALSDDRLANPVACKNYNVYVLLHGIIQHDLYHAGQIALLKRAIRT
jgi:uncharacterized damage-inducible protein DinB